MSDNPVEMMLDTPLPKMIEQLGLAIANAQFALDRNAVEIAKLLADEANGIRLAGEDKPRSMLELGFAPSFYHLTEASIDAKVAFSISRSSEFSAGASVSVNYFFVAASVNASYSQKYSFDASASSAISAKFVSVPPPAAFQDLLRASVGKKTDNP
jgi:hypothetical protein